MSWEQTAANQELTAGVGLVDSGLQFNTGTQDHGVCVSLESAAAHLIAKRLYDVFFATLGLIVLSPVLLLLALILKLSSRGPIFYRQHRIGQFGIPFFIWKFRT